MTTKLKMFFIAMDFLTLMVYPIVFLYGRLQQLLKPQAVRDSVENLADSAAL